MTQLGQNKAGQSKGFLKRHGILPVILVVLVLAFGLRGFDFAEDVQIVAKDFNYAGFNVAIASDDEGANGDSMLEEMTPDNVFSEPPTLPSRDFLEEGDFSSSEVEILQSLSQRRKEIEKKERGLQQKEALLAAAEKQIETKMAELGALRQEIQNLLGQQQEEQEGRIKSLVRMYESMKAKDAATIFDTLEMDVLLSVIGRMSERKAAPVLAQMSPDVAREVTIRLAAQKQLPQLPEN